MRITGYALVHRSCGHVGGLGSSRAEAQAFLAVLQDAGYFQWRIRAVDAAEQEQVLAALAGHARAGCVTCKVDPTRGLLPEALQAAAGAVAEHGRIPVVRR
jgi:hypothetical protein